jgi:hypothetical protein
MTARPCARCKEPESSCRLCNTCLKALPKDIRQEGASIFRHARHRKGEWLNRAIAFLDAQSGQLAMFREEAKS